MSKKLESNNKIMASLKGKSAAISVPSVKFVVEDEQIEELRGSTSADDNDVPGEGSPLKLLPRLNRRSTSVDAQNLDSSDPWRFFSDIKGKITKSVEEKITEIKSRNHDENSPSHKSKGAGNGKESSSVSDSEDLSESSISKTCGIVSTTEGAEMSSDEDTNSLDKKPTDSQPGTTSSSLRHRFRFLRIKNPPTEDGTIEERHLTKIYNVNVDNALPEDEIESAVDALEETELKNDDVLSLVTEKIDNFHLENDEKDGKILKIKEVQGIEVREDFFDCKNEDEKTVFAPQGFVDLRQTTVKYHANYNYYQYIPVIVLAVISFGIIQYYLPYVGGIVTGALISFIVLKTQHKLNSSVPEKKNFKNTNFQPGKIFEIDAVTEYQPLQKYEGWMNEYPDNYSPETYHVSHTQSVFVRLQGNLLRLSHSRTKVPKRAMWNEPEIETVFTHHRIYNLAGAKLTLLPHGLTKKRRWSKKYPICVLLAKDQMCFDSEVLAKIESEDEKNLDKKNVASSPAKTRKTFGRFRKKDYSSMAQRFSKLNDEQDGFDLDSDSRASTPSVDTSDVTDPPIVELEDINDLDDFQDDWSSCCCDDPEGLRIYLFGRTDREKEDWFRRFMIATKENVLNSSRVQLDYLKLMNGFKANNDDNLLWLNTFIGRILFDAIRNPIFIHQVKDRIERKLSTIKLPYFIEELLIPELSMGETTPIIKKAGEPVTDERGLWMDLDIVYEGLIVLTLQTKLNLMRLKNPQAYEKPVRNLRSAIYHSDVDDSAESSSDDDAPMNQEIPNLIQDASGTPTSTSGKKNFIKMVDRLTESKIFQAATENKFIKKAMEGVSNTDLRLTVEVKSVIGTVVLNIPPPPTDRVWVGFRPVPEISISARPIVGERHLSYMMVTSWIEKKLLLEFQKVMVIPNMEDFAIPVMNPKLPD